MPIPVIVPIIAIGCAFTAPVLGMAAAGADRRRSFLHLHSSRPQPSTHAHTHGRFADGAPLGTFLTLGKTTQAAIRALRKCRTPTASRSGSTAPLASTLSRYTYIPGPPCTSAPDPRCPTPAPDPCCPTHAAREAAVRLYGEGRRQGRWREGRAAV
jgi:hypothetical protein